ncbi:MAG: hypothetical protein H6538_07870 [Bacteroidales bacterium]|nr:hypothetical protein [Bacteroidales bacterium]
MKTLRNFFKSEKGKPDPKRLQDYSDHDNHNHGHQSHTHNGDKGHNPSSYYICPMKCEGDKTYDAQGNCPVCNMKLIPAESNSSQGHHHGCC